MDNTQDQNKNLKGKSELKQSPDLFAEQLGTFLGGDVQSEGVSADETKDVFLDRFYRRMAADGLRHQHNLGTIVSESHSKISADSKGSMIDQDWLARFILLAKEVGGSEMQKVWSKVLLKQFEEPGSFSFVALSCLSNMDISDVNILNRISELSFHEGYIFKIAHSNDLAFFNLHKMSIAKVQALGLMHDSYDLSVIFIANQGGLTFEYKGANLILHNPNLSKFVIPTYKMSLPGTEFMSLFANNEVDINYLRALGEGLVGDGYTFRIRLPDGSLSL